MPSMFGISSVPRSRSNSRIRRRPISRLAVATRRPSDDSLTLTNGRAANESGVNVPLPSIHVSRLGGT
jgi:hypothetical protein